MKKIIRKPPLGLQLHNMYVQILMRDEGKSVAFVDSLKPFQKKALSLYWKNHEQNELRQLFFKSANG